MLPPHDGITGVPRSLDPREMGDSYERGTPERRIRALPSVDSCFCQDESKISRSRASDSHGIGASRRWEHTTIAGMFWRVPLGEGESSVTLRALGRNRREHACRRELITQRGPTSTSNGVSRGSSRTKGIAGAVQAAESMYASLRRGELLLCARFIGKGRRSDTGEDPCGLVYYRYILIRDRAMMVARASSADH